MTPIDLLRRSVAELEETIKRPDEKFRVLRAASLIRLLVLDQRTPNLLDDAWPGGSSAARFRIAQRLSGWKIIDRSPTAQSRGAMMHPLAPWPDGPTVTVDREGLAAERALHLHAGLDGTGYDHSVRDVVRFAANVLGGVHYRQPSTVAERRMALFFEDEPDSGETMIASSICDIGSVVVAGLTSH